MKNIKHSNSLVWLYGIHAIEAIIKHHPYAVKELRIGATQKKLIQLFKNNYNQNIIEVDAKFFQDFPKGNQKIAALANLDLKQPPLNKLIHTSNNPICLIAFDGITDPQNLGACIRSAKAFDATAIILQKHNSCSVTPLVHKISAGAASCMPIYTVTNLHQTIRSLKKDGIWTFGTSEHAQTALTEYREKKSSLIVFGSEGKGIRPIIAKELDYVFAIPTSNSFQSLNVSMACSVALYHFQQICQ